jgi:oxygen-independent coproporphyrinogen-3 oxidase
VSASAPASLPAATRASAGDDARPPADLAAAAAIAARYATTAPRYTSYPTAPHFTAEVDFAALRAAWAGAQGPLGAYLHVPFCERRCLYCGCHVEIARNRGLGAAYVDDLLAELDALADHTDLSRPLEVVALGGGTPTWLAPADMARLIEGLRARLRPAEGCEWSIEVDPRSLTVEEAKALKSQGFRRFSLGVQDLDPDVLRAVGRAQGPEQVAAIAEALGGEALNFDLMVGLPGQTVASMRRTVRQAVALGASRFAVFGYAHVPWMRPHQRGLERGAGLPGQQERLALTLTAREELQALGFLALGIDHYARPDDSLAVAAAAGRLGRNFMGYSDRAEVDLLGLGVSAIGAMAGAFAANQRDLGAWRSAARAGTPSWERGLLSGPDDRQRGWVIQRLLCDLRLDKAAFAARFGLAFDAHYAAERAAIAPLVAEGLAFDDAEALGVRGLGWLVVRNLAAVFDAYLERGGARYSRTI